MFSSRRGRPQVFVWAAFIVVAVLFATVPILRADRLGDSPTRVESLFIDSVRSSKPVRTLAGTEATAARQVELNPKVQSADRWTAGDSIEIALFDGRSRTARINRVTEDVNGTVTLSAKIDGSEWGYFILSTTGKKSLGTLAIPETGETYEIKPESEETHLFAETEESELSDWTCGALEPPITATAGERRPSARATQSTGLPSDPVTIDLMVAYTPAARQWADTYAGGIFNVIAVSMAQANLVLENSATFLSWNLAGTVEVDYNESGSSSLDLKRLVTSRTFRPYGYNWNGNPLTGYMDEVHDHRDASGADLVTLLASVHDVGGLAWVLRDAEGSPEWGFNLVKVQQATMGFTFVHELGHNLGLHHHHTQNFQPGPGVFPYSSGWRWTSPDNNDYGYASTMTYGAGSYFADGIASLVLPYFSNPEIDHDGIPTGDSRLADNARTVREMKHRIADYRHRSNITLAQALGQFDWEWETGGNAPWIVRGIGVGAEGYAAESGTVSDNQESWVETAIDGPGNLHFWWRISSERDYDFLHFSVGDEEFERISGDSGWQRKTFKIPFGHHTLRWCYRKDQSVSQGEDAAWIDKIVWEPTSPEGPPTYTEWLALAELPADQQDIWDDPGDHGMPNWLRYAFGLDPYSPERMRLPRAEIRLLPIENFPEDYLAIRFWQSKEISDLVYRPEASGDLVNWEPVGDAEFQIETIENGQWKERVVRDLVPIDGEERRFLRVSVFSRIGEVVGEPLRDWRTGGNKSWFDQKKEFFSNNRSMQTGRISHHQRTWIETTVEGPGTFRFYWQVSSEAGWDNLRFFIDNEEMTQFSGEHDWEQRTFLIPEGVHRVRWEYTKDGSFSSGRDAAWLDQVEWIPD